MDSGFVDVTLVIYNTMGQLVKTLYRNELALGSYGVKWYGRTDSGNLVSSGIYFALLKADRFSQIKKLVLLK